MDAHGGLDRWRQMKTVSARLLQGGVLWGLKGKDGIRLYRKLNQQTGISHDPCMADTLMAAVDFMNGGSPKPWWSFTAKRKAVLK